MPNFEKHFPKNTRPATRNYLKEMHGGRIGGALRGAGRVLGTIGKGLVQPSPIREKMIKEHGKYYTRPYGKGGTTISGEKGKRFAQSIKYLDKDTKKAIEYMIARRDPQKKWSPKQKGITAEQIQKEAYPQLVKEFGEQGANELMKALTLGKGMDPQFSKYRGGKEVRLEEALKDLRKAKNVRKEKMPIARQIIKGLMTPYEPMSRRGFTQEEVAEVAKEAKEELGEKPATRFEETFGVERHGQQEEQTHMRAPSRIEKLQQGRGKVVVPQGFKQKVNALTQKISSLNK